MPDQDVPPAPAPAEPATPVAVRALCAFALRRGDLEAGWGSHPSAQEGVQGHALVASRRGGAYRRELPLQADVGGLRVRGRADGWDPQARRLEEVKTFRGRLERQPAGVRALHWAQLRLYGALLCRTQGLAEVELALVYLELGSGRETVLTQQADAAALERELQQACAAFEAWARQERAHRAARDAAMAVLRFPHAAFRPGQRALAENVWHAARRGRCLLAQAPTGIGKTLGTLFPLLKALPGERLDRVAFLTAKTSGRALALEALATLRRQDVAAADGAPAPRAFPLRVLELVAREKSCEHPDKACHGASCPLAAGFYDRLPAAREAAVHEPAWDREGLRALAARHGLCPWHLAQELAPWADVFVGDYNHWFDPSALLHGLAVAEGWRTALLVDEAHNLVERARRMWSAELDPAVWRQLARSTGGEMQRALRRVQRQWKVLEREALADTNDAPPEDPAPAREATTYCVLDAVPGAFVEALQLAANAVLAQLAEEPAGPDAAALRDFAFDALHFAALAAGFGPHALLDVQAQGRWRRLALRNVVPAPHLQPRWEAAHTATLFSATLQPPSHHRQLLGLPEDTACLAVDGPFSAAQLQVRVARGLSTRWPHRAATLPRIVATMAAQYGAAPGLYLAFFSSYAYLRQAFEAFTARHPDVPAWAQAQGMSEAEQAAFVARFVPGGRGIGFAVLGGAFGEGIDLPGERLIGAFVATLGLPQVNPVNEQMRQRLQQLLGTGFESVYLWPGLQKVVQAAGRVIRTPEDRGVLHLLDERFAQAQVRALLPAWWQLEA